MTTRYVDADAEVGGDGTTPALTGANCAYKSLNIAEAALPATLTDAWEIICGSAHANHTADTTAVTFSGVTTSAANYIDVYASVAGRHAGVWSNSKYRITSSVNYTHVLYVYDEIHIRFRYLQIKQTGLYGACIRVGYYNSPTVLIDSVICAKCNDYTLIYIAGSTLTTIRNSIIYNATRISYDAPGLWVAGGTVLVENCTSCANGDEGFLRAAGTLTIKNSYAGGNTGADFSGTMTDTTCASEDGTKGTTVAYSTSSGAYFTNITPGSEDFHIGASSELIGAGTDLSGTFTLDIDGETRVAWDIGADEYISGGATYNESFSLAGSAGIQKSSQLDAVTSFSAAITAGITKHGVTIIPVSTNLGVTAVLSAVGGLKLNEGFTLAALGSLAIEGALVIPVSINLQNICGFASSGQLDAVAALTFPVSKSFQLTPQLLIDSALAVSGVLDLSLVGGGDFTEALTLAAQAGIASARTLLIPAVFEIGAVVGQQLQAQAVVNPIIGFDAEMDQVVAGAVEMDAALSLPVAADQQVAGGMDHAGAFSLGAEAGHSLLASVDFGAYLNLGAQAGVAVIPQLIAVAAFSIDAQVAAQLKAGLELNAALTLSVTIAAQIEGQLQIVQIPAELVITDEALVTLSLGDSVAMAVTLTLSDAAQAEIQTGTTMATYDIGDVAKLTATIKQDGVAVDPSTVQVTVKKPSGTTTIYVSGTDPEVTNPAVGSYVAAIPIDESGIWWYEWACTNPNGTEENSLTVRTSKV